MDLELKFRKILTENKQSLTNPRLKIYKKLQAINEPITVAQLVLEVPEVDKVSTYRTIDLFERIGIVHRVWTGFKSKIELSEELSHHHHHFTCISCGKTTALKSDELEDALHDFEGQHGFTLTHHSVELSGYCKQCSLRRA